jgi:hypothetical protein
MAGYGLKITVFFLAEVKIYSPSYPKKPSRPTDFLSKEFHLLCLVILSRQNMKLIIHFLCKIWGVWRLQRLWRCVVWYAGANISAECGVSVSEKLLSVPRATYCHIQEFSNCHSPSSVVYMQTVKIFTSMALPCFHPA